ncbi:MAG: 5,6-dimethylbenzimidazole synthase [Actinomycetota bacterium]|nr:5,6-dimethylbenzimidazole synthase [Actinomycetota bacterium]
MKEGRETRRPGSIEGSAEAFPQIDGPNGGFPPEAKDGVYAAIFGRRDVRSFLDDPVPEEVLVRILTAAHHAPSVGFMQPWDFLLIRDRETRESIKELSDKERQAAAIFFDEPRRSKYLSMKLEGILDAPLNLCVTCDPTRGGPQVLGRSSIPETDVYSTCLAVQNLWLAARAEGVGVGWVSILRNAELRGILGMPPHVIPVSYLCLGYPKGGFPDEPLLQKNGWRDRLSLDALVRRERWDAEGGVLPCGWEQT